MVGGSDDRRLAFGDLRMAGSPLLAAAEMVWWRWPVPGRSEEPTVLITGEACGMKCK